MGSVVIKKLGPPTGPKGTPGPKTNPTFSDAAVNASDKKGAKKPFKQNLSPTGFDGWPSSKPKKGK
jgi:hypothetical protein